MKCSFFFIFYAWNTKNNSQIINIRKTSIEKNFHIMPVKVKGLKERAFTSELKLTQKMNFGFAVKNKSVSYSMFSTIRT